MRRIGATALAAALATVGLVGPAAAAPAPAASVDWPQYRADGAHTGDVAAQPGLDPTNVAQRGLRLATEVTLGSGAADASAAGPRAFTIGGFVLAADIASGATDWTSTDVETSLGPVAVSGGIVLTDTTSPGPLTGLDASTGAVRWALPGQDQPVTPATVDAAGDSAYLATDTGSSFLLRQVAVATGAPGWSTTLPAGTVGAATPTVAGGRVLVQTLQAACASTGTCRYRSVLTAYAVGTGRPVWTTTTSPSGSGSTPAPTVAVVGSTVYAVGADGTLGAYAAGTGAHLWTQPVAASLRAAPAVAGGTVLVGTDTGRLVAADTTDGHVLWRARVGTTGVSTPAVAGRVVWVTVDDDLVAVDLAHGTVLRSVPTGATVFDRDPVVAHDRVLVVAQFDDEATLQVYAPA